METAFDKFKKQPVLFNTNQEALVYYAKELEVLADKYSLTSESLVILADESSDFNPDFDKALTLSSIIRSLKLTVI